MQIPYLKNISMSIYNGEKDYNYKPDRQQSKMLILSTNEDQK